MSPQSETRQHSGFIKATLHSQAFNWPTATPGPRRRGDYLSARCRSIDDSSSSKDSSSIEDSSSGRDSSSSKDSSSMEDSSSGRDSSSSETQQEVDTSNSSNNTQQVVASDVTTNDQGTLPQSTSSERGQEDIQGQSPPKPGHEEAAASNQPAPYSSTPLPEPAAAAHRIPDQQPADTSQHAQTDQSQPPEQPGHSQQGVSPSSQHPPPETQTKAACPAQDEGTSRAAGTEPAQPSSPPQGPPPAAGYEDPGSQNVSRESPHGQQATPDSGGSQAGVATDASPLSAAGSGEGQEQVEPSPSQEGASGGGGMDKGGQEAAVAGEAQRLAEEEAVVLKQAQEESWQDSVESETGAGMGTGTGAGAGAGREDDSKDGVVPGSSEEAASELDGEFMSGAGKDLAAAFQKEINDRTLQPILNMSNPFDGSTLRQIIYERFKKHYDVALVHTEAQGRSDVAIHIGWKHEGDPDFALYKSEYVEHTEYMAAVIRSWGVEEAVNSGIQSAKDVPEKGKPLIISLQLSDEQIKKWFEN